MLQVQETASPTRGMERGMPGRAKQVWERVDEKEARNRSEQRETSRKEDDD